MRVAVSLRNKRIAPIFDINRDFLILDIENGKVLCEFSWVLRQNAPCGLVLDLKGMKIDLVICGAISRFLEKMLTSQGIGVIPFVSGEVKEIRDALLSGNLDSSRFAMPGCRFRLESDLLQNSPTFHCLRRRQRGRWRQKREGGEC